MASKSNAVYLGFLDDQVTTKNQHHLNFTVSKVGGHPNWCAGESKLPSCTVCKRKMLLVLHVYAPLENNNYHRILYIFACIDYTCWNKPHSWICLRSQVLESKQPLITQSTDVTNEFWMNDDDDDDWGPEIDDGNGNIFPQFQQLQDNITLKTSHFIAKENLNIDANLNQREPNSSFHNIGLTDVVKCMENQMHLSEKGDSNANDALCGAVGAQGGSGDDSMEATAVIEGPEGDMIAVDSPEQPTTDIPALFKEIRVVETKGDVAFVSYFIGTSIEPQEDKNFSEHERELFLQYTHSTGHNLKEKDCFAAPDLQGDDSIYEKIVAHHGDILLHKFKKRVSRSPEQIMRYCREESASPLWMRSPNYSVIPKSCGNCGGRLIFEMQVMPQLVSCLRLKDFPSPVLEFGTVAIYTCLSSCWTEGDSVKTEFCYVQSEEA